MTITIRSEERRPRGIPTTYNGTRFRSRLEARWAAFFDLVGWRWTYEPFDAEGWIPDFLIHGTTPFLIEVGPCITRTDYETKAGKCAIPATRVGHDLLVLGVTPRPDLAIANGELAAGLLGEWSEDGMWFETAVWAEGNGHLDVYHTYGSYQHRPGPGHERALPLEELFWLDERWRTAGNSVQWRRR